MQLRVANGGIAEARFKGDSCAICMASADLLAEQFPGVPVSRPLLGRETLLSIDAARRDLGYTPRHSWLDAVE